MMVVTGEALATGHGVLIVVGAPVAEFGSTVIHSHASVIVAAAVESARMTSRNVANIEGATRVAVG
jgi:hypothetical protein